ncbi:MAG: AAA family ATPase [Pyrinomonadaceae bacterium]
MTDFKSATPVYFKSLELENVRCFRTTQKLDLTDKHGRPAQWTLLMGDNGVGKTTLLQCLAWMRPLLQEATQSKANQQMEANSSTSIDEDTERTGKRLELAPALNNEDNDVLESLFPPSTETSLELKGTLCQGQDFHSFQPCGEMRTAIQATGKGGVLEDSKLEGNSKIEKEEDYRKCNIISYGAMRYIDWGNLAQREIDNDHLSSLLTGRTALYDPEEILVSLNAAANLNSKNKEIASKRLKSVLEMIVATIPFISSKEDIEILGPKIPGGVKEGSGVWFKIRDGKVPLSALSLGYQITLAWMVDLAWRLFQLYHKSENPLLEPAVVLVDELDLHLHPRWQRTIIRELTPHFPRIQFIATTHSPLMVQAAANENLVVLQQKNEEVEINSDPLIVEGWRVDQILTSELFDVSSRSVKKEELFRERDALLDNPKRTEDEDRRLNNLEKQIERLPTFENPQDQEEAMRLIQQAAEILKRNGALLP